MSQKAFKSLGKGLSWVGLTGLGYGIAFYIGNRVTTEFILFPNSDSFMNKLTDFTSNMIQLLMEHPLRISFSKASILGGLVVCLMIGLIHLYQQSNRNNFRVGEEHGSARWATQKETTTLASSNFQDNIILAENVSLNSDTSLTRLNNNIVVIGAPGTGKTWGIIKPNLAQKRGSYLVADPKGTVFRDTAQMFMEAGYVIKVFNTDDLSQSMRYNPFRYINKEEDILSMIESIILNTSGTGDTDKNDFWVKAEKLLLSAFIGYIIYECQPHEHTFESLMLLLNESEVKEDDEDYISGIDELFYELEETHPNHFALRQYKKFKLAAGETAKSILISIAARLSPFDIDRMLDLTSSDELELERLGSEKTILYVILSDHDNTFNFLIAMMYTQLFNTLIKVADQSPEGKLESDLFLLMDEIANTGRIHNFDKILATIRSRHIYALLALQGLNQLRDMYKETYEKVIATCSTLVFLGGSETLSLELVSKLAGKTTVDMKTVSETKGAQGSYSLGNQAIARDLITVSEIKELDVNQCIISILGKKPILANKYNLRQHPHYQQLADHDPSRRQFLSNYLKAAPLLSLQEKNVVSYQET